MPCAILLYDLFNPSRSPSLDTHVILFTVRRNSSQDASLCFDIEKVQFLSVNQLQIVILPNTSPSQRLLRSEVKSLLTMHTLMAETRVDGRPKKFVCGFLERENHHIWWAGLTVAGGVTSIPPWARSPQLGMPKEGDTEPWEDRLIRRSKLSATKIKRGVEPKMTARDWARFCEAVSVIFSFSILVRSSIALTNTNDGDSSPGNLTPPRDRGREFLSSFLEARAGFFWVWRSWSLSTPFNSRTLPLVRVFCASLPLLSIRLQPTSIFSFRKLS